MEILLGTGIGKLLFGFTEAEAVETLGVADKSFKTDLGCQRLQFNQAMLDLSFEPENEGLLGWIEVHHQGATLFGHPLIGKSKETVLDLLIIQLGSPSEVEDYDSFETVFYEEQWLELQFRFGKLSNLNFGVLYNKDDEPIWPKKNGFYHD